MSAETPVSAEPLTVEWDQILLALFASLGIKEGLWSVGVGFNFAGLNAGPDRNQILPSALVSVRGITLRQVASPGPMVFDARTGKRVDFSDDSRPVARKASAVPVAPRRRAAATAKKAKGERR